jgi:hypothetical protein
MIPTVASLEAAYPVSILDHQVNGMLYARHDGPSVIAAASNVRELGEQIADHFERQRRVALRLGADDDEARRETQG